MDEIKAKAIINQVKTHYIGNGQTVEALEIAVTALEKQIPIKVAIDDDTEFTCPTCGKTTEDYDVTTLKVCPECGQKLQWE